tara:strand:- start:371 stop:739 length:369 start_codon:yes stop_codon:yes gene_type:complete
MANSKQHRYANSFKHEVCQYYEHHTRKATQEKYGVDERTIGRWRVALGYRNKHFGYNIYTEAMQPALKKRERRDFMVTKKDNAFLLNEVNDLKSRIKAKDLDSAWLRDKLHQIADAIKTQEI